MEKTLLAKRTSWDSNAFFGYFFGVPSSLVPEVEMKVEMKLNEAERAERKRAARFRRLDELARNLDSILERNQS